MSRRRHRGFGSLHATALASKMRQQSDWTGKNYLFNIDCRWLADWAMSAYISKPVYLVFYEITNNIIPVHRLFLNPRYGERSTSTYPLPPDANVGQYSTSKVIFTPKSFINSAIRNVPSPQDIIVGCAAKTSYPGCVRRPNLPCAHYIWHYMMEHLFVCLVHIGVVLMYFGRQ